MSELAKRMRQVLEHELIERAHSRLSAHESLKPWVPESENHTATDAGPVDPVSPVTAGGESVKASPVSTTERRLQGDVLRIAAAALRIPEDRLDPAENLANYGIDSIAITEVMAQLSQFLSISVAPTTFFEARNLDDLSRILLSRYGEPIALHYQHDAEKVVPTTLSTSMIDTADEKITAAPDVESWLSRHGARQGKRVPAASSAADISDAVNEPGIASRVTAIGKGGAVPVAVIAMDGKFPKSPDLDSFEAHLRSGDDCIEEIPEDRWDWRAVYGDPKKGPYTNVKYGGFVPGYDCFDAAFFKISPSEAEVMDPQHRLFMECVWRLIESGGYAPGSLAGRKVGLFLGINLQDYTDLANRAGLMEAVQMTGLGHVFCPNRLSYLLDIHGPSQVIDTACSSSLVAVHRAVMSIRHEGCEMAIAGGANLLLTSRQHVMFSKVGMICEDGRCKSFSRHANGYARADGIGAVLLKRLDLAERDGDPILGVIRSSVENHGGGASSLTAPNPVAQARLIVEAHRQADIDPRSVSMVECHGTGTPLGDPVEVEGLKTAFTELYREQGLTTPVHPHCGLGSVKSNIGHAETAAGVAGLIKVLLAMRTSTLYRSLHCDEPNPLLDLDGSPFYLLNSARPWIRPTIDGVEQPRRAGLSSFGAGGANAHLVIEEYQRPALPSPAASPLPLVVPLSAKNDVVLSEMVRRLRPYLEQEELADLAYTLQIGRDPLRVRVAFVVHDREELTQQLDAFLLGDAAHIPQGVIERRRRERDGILDPSGLDPREIAERWVRGETVDWSCCHPEHGRRRLRLPGYPFQGQRYWLPLNEETVSAAQASLATSAVESVSESIQFYQLATNLYRVELNGSEFFLDHHRLQGRPVLPGVVYLELARAVAYRVGLTNVGLRKLVWLKPLIVTMPTSVEVALIYDEDGDEWPRVEISSTDARGERQLHAQARFAAPVIVDSGVPADMAALTADHPQRIDAEQIYRVFADMEIDYGLGHRVIESLNLGTDNEGRRRVFGHLRLPEAFVATMDGYVLHPSLMDGAFQAALGMALDESGQPQEEGAALPFALDSVEILGPCSARMWVCVRQTPNHIPGNQVRTLELDLLDGKGVPRVRMRGFATRVLAQRPGNAVMLFEPQWDPVDEQAVVEPADFSDRRALLCGFNTVDPQVVQNSLRGWNCLAFAVTEKADLSQRFLQYAQQLLAEIQSLLPGSSTSPVLLQVALAEEEDAAMLSGLSGLLRTAQLEHSWLWCQMIGLEPKLEAAAIAQGLKEAAQQPQLSRLRRHDGMMQYEGWRAAGQLGDEHPFSKPWRTGGVYLITGGAGALGRHLTEEILASVSEACIVLIGRAELDSERQDWLGALTANVTYERVNLTDTVAVHALVTAIRNREGRIDGILHAAGIIHDAALSDKRPASMAEVLAPKVAGTLNLDAAVGTASLDFFVVFASLSGVFGNPGQADYAAANAFLDGFAVAREARRVAGNCQGRTLAVDWPLWRDGGMRMSDSAQALMTRTSGLTALSTSDGMTALYRALATAAPQVLVAAGDAAHVRSRVLGKAAPPDWGAVELPVSKGDATLDVTDSELDKEQLRERVEASLVRQVSKQLKVAPEDLALDTELSEYGFDSISFTQFANALNEQFKLELVPTLFFEYPTLEVLAHYLTNNHGVMIAAILGVETQAHRVENKPMETAAVPPSRRVATPPSRPDEQDSTNDTGVAIVGMSGVFPSAPNLDVFWQNLINGRDCIREVPGERWDWRDYWGDPASEAGCTNVKWGGFIEELAEFDASFFGISAPEARMMDPQQRVLLTQAWRAIEDAGYGPRSLAGSQTGVFIGTADVGYGRLLADAGSDVEGYSMTGLAPSLGPNRISFHLNLNGPSVAVETACSSALVAIHRAVESIAAGGCDAALAGGINALLLPDAYIGFSKAGMLSPDGRCKPFSAQANGYARGEGAGLIFLKKLTDAERDGDRILAVIRASAENHGGRASSLTAPNPKAQADLLRKVYRRAGFDPRTVSYIEAHGTGTPLGDPIEVEALSSAFAELAQDAESEYGSASEISCGIGSVKSNIGHLELAAGIAGVMKVLLQIKHGVLAKTLHCDELNPYLQLGRFHVVRENEPWTRPVDAAGSTLPRRAGVSSFGFGGSNAHVVLEEYTGARRSSVAIPGPAMIVLSANTEEQLQASAQELLEALPELDTESTLVDLAYSLQVARDAMEYRLAFVAGSLEQVAERLRAFVDLTEDDALYHGRVKPHRDTIALLQTDAELRRSLVGLPARGRPETLLKLWVRGLSFDWRVLYEKAQPRRVALPGYPFARTRFWVTSPTSISGNSPAAPTITTHLFDGSEFFLRDHRVGGHAILPGVVHLELLRSALQEYDNTKTLELREHVWLRPVVVDAPLAVRVEITLADDGSNNYAIVSDGASGHVLHSQGRALYTASKSVPAQNLAQLRADAPRQVDVGKLYERFAELGLDYGPAHRALRGIHVGEGLAVATLELPEAAGDDAYGLQPSLLDGALQAALSLTPVDETTPARPYALRRMAVYGPTTHRMVAVLHARDSLYHIDLCDEDGNVRVRLEGFASRTESGSKPSAQPQPNANKEDSYKRALDALITIAAKVLEVQPSVLEVDTELGEFGFDSITMTGFASKVNAELGLSLTPADFFEFATLTRLAEHIADDMPVLVSPSADTADNDAFASTASLQSPPSVPSGGDEQEPVAIVGLSCRFPMASDAEAFWDNLLAGKDCISRVPPDRWDWQAMDGDPKHEPTKTNVHWGGFIDGVFEFDPLFFGISPREARLMDPQQRLMMMHVWKAIEDAGHSPRSLAGRSVGVFVGTSSSGYRELIGEDSGGEGYVATGAVPSVGPNRISYFLDWHGPSEPVETACSSSLVAIHKALQAMRAGDCEMAVVGGVNTIVTPEAHINFAKAGMLAPDGRCKTFSSRANGYGRGEGVGMLVLKRLSHAERDGDSIYGLIRGSAVNHGGRANSLTAPNTAAQADLLKQAYSRAGIDPRSIGYIEAHGTGTALGDPVEVNALKSAFRELVAGTPEDAYQGVSCGLGSVKSSIGHLELAAGVAGVIKVLLQLQHRTLAPTLHCTDQNPYIDLEGSPFDFVKKAQPWTPIRDAQGRDLPRRAGISSFGFGGVNAHLIIEEYPVPERPAPARQEQALIVLSARDPARLEDQARQLLSVSSDFEDADLQELAYTLQVGREAMKHRLATTVGALAELRRHLRAFLDGDSSEVLTGRLEAGTLVPTVDFDVDTDLGALARHWVRGGAVDWRRHHPVGLRRRHLPTYPFASDTYHVNSIVGAPPYSPALQTARAFSSVPSTGSAAGTYYCQLDAAAFYLHDHRVDGVRMLPGAMSLELVCMAYANDRNQQNFAPVSLTRVLWLQPLTVGEGDRIDARIELSPDEQGDSEFRLLTGDVGKLHARGMVTALQDVPLPSMDLMDLRRRCSVTFDTEHLYALYTELGMHYGASLRGVNELWLGAGEVLARLRVPEMPIDGNDVFILHPSIVDAAFQSCLSLFAAGDETQPALPFALERIDILKPTKKEMWAHVRERPAEGGVRKIDIDLADVRGIIHVRMHAFSVRLQDGGSRPDSEATEPEMSPGDLHAAGARYLAQIMAQETEVALQEIEPEAALEAYGIDSVMITRLTDRLEQDFGPLSKTLFFEYQTLDALTSYFVKQHAEVLSEVTGGVDATTLVSSIASEKDDSDSAPPYVGQPIAIVGLAGRYPGARNLQEFWHNLAAGRDSITEVPTERWDHSRLYDAVDGQAGKVNSKWGGFIEGYDRFDPLFFNISPRDAEIMDPQERLFLQCAWETLEDAGYTRAGLASGDDLPGGNVGVYVGVMYEEYQLYGAESTQAGQPLALPGSPASIANRVSYFCNFQGPSLAVDTMCSSSLTAIHLACDSLRSGDCDAALAGGVNLSLHPNKYLALGQGRFLSSKGRCESFGEGGDGYVPGEGVGAVLLKRLDQAIDDGDHIYGVIRGSALNHGGKTNGYTVPNPRAQSAAISRALARAGVAPRAVSYIEAHGTGTSLGDPIEINALTEAFRAQTEDRGFCAIGSVKSNIGHCESAAGIAGLSKLLLQLKHGQLVPSLHSESLNPGIDFANSPFTMQRTLQPWPSAFRDDDTETARIAGLSSFGAGGSNAHLIIEEFRTPGQPRIAPQTELFPLSARDDERLMEMTRNLRDALRTLSEQEMSAVARLLQEGREPFEERLAVVAPDKANLIAALDGVLAGEGSIFSVHRGQARKRENSTHLKQLLRENDLDGLAAFWATGGQVEWSVLHEGRPRPRKLSLPTYPFAQERYWAPEHTTATQPVNMSLPTERTVTPAIKPPLPLFFEPYWQTQALIGGETSPASVRVVLCDFPSDRVKRLSSKLAHAQVYVLTEAGAPIAKRYNAYAVELLKLLGKLFDERPEHTLLQLVLPAKADALLLEGLAGLLRSARLEGLSVAYQLICTDAADESIATDLKAEQSTGTAEIRYLDGERKVRTWRELIPPAGGGAMPWKDGGVYLITGGSGGVGQRLCEAIAQDTCNAVLYVTGRSGWAEQVQTRLEALSAKVQYRRVDVTESAEVRVLIEEILRDHGRLDGVVHAAGLVRDKLLVSKSAEELCAVLAPKVAGLVNLDQATADLPLDFMLLFGSVSGALGNVGQCDYAAANAFMDGYAANRNRMRDAGGRHGLTLAVDWPYWREGGMHLDDSVLDAMERGFGVRPLSTDTAMAALGAAMTLDKDQVLILDGDPTELRAWMLPFEVAVESTATEVTDRNAEHEDGTEPALRKKVEHWIGDCIAGVLKIPVERLDPIVTLDRFGIESVSALQVLDLLERELGALPSTLLFEYPKISLLAEELLKTHQQVLREWLLPHASGTEDPADNTSGSDKQKGAASDEVHEQDIAVIAVAGRYPGADSVEEFWELLEKGRDCVTTVPIERWDHSTIYSSAKGKLGASYCNWGGFLNDADCFDAEFFGYTPREAALAEPEQRLFLQTVWHLLERAGYTRATLRDHHDSRVGVYVGAMYQQYREHAHAAEDRALLALSSYSSIANRTSYFFDLQGPSVAVDSMCASGLQAVHQACQSLRLGECRLAIAGGVNLSLHPYKYVGLSRTGLVGSHAESRSFADGDGYLPAEGVGAVLLKPLAAAQRDGDNILGVIKGSAASHGGHSAGYGVPNAEVQAQLIAENLRAASIDPRSISYVEAAANGSPIGDAIELRALSRTGIRCAIGSVKTNMGHAEAASGLAQLTKVLLQLQHRHLVPSVQPIPVNPKLDFVASGFTPQIQAAHWPRPTVDGREYPRRATVSSFGAGGSNVHLIVEEAPDSTSLDPKTDAVQIRYFRFSAHSRERLEALLALMVVHLRAHPELSLERLEQTLRHGREPMASTIELSARSHSELLSKLVDPNSWEPVVNQQAVTDTKEPPAGPPLVLPGYPFTRERHWLAQDSALPSRPPNVLREQFTEPASILARILDLLAAHAGRSVEMLDPNAGFRTQGADSMFALRLIHEVTESTGVELEHRSLELHHSPALLARYIAERQAMMASPIVPTVPGSDPSWRTPLSEGQKGLWVLQKLYPQSSAYNVPLAFRLPNANREALAHTCNWLLERFPILSTVIEVDENEPYMCSHSIDQPLYELTRAAEEEELTWLRQRASRAFTLESEAPIRFELIRAASGSPDTDVLLIVAHHIVIDGVSAALLGEHFRNTYTQFLQGESPEPASPQTEYIDFVDWERRHLTSTKGAEQLAYWRRQLTDEPSQLNMPADRPPSPDGLLLARSRETVLPEELANTVRLTAGEMGISPAVFFLGVMNFLFYRYTGQQDFVVGVPVMRRPERRFDKTVGYFANVMPLRVYVSGSSSAATLLADMQRLMSEGLDHADYPYTTLSREMGRTPQSPALYQLSYAYQSFFNTQPSADIDGCSYVYELRQEVDGPFGLDIFEEGETFRIVAGYDGVRFDDSTVERMLTHFSTMLEAVCTRPETTVAALKMMSLEEREQILEIGNSNCHLTPCTGWVHDWIAQQAQKSPNAIALSGSKRCMSYRKLNKRVNRLAAHLHARGVVPGDAVAVLLDRGPDSVVALLAVLSAGCMWVPLDFDYPKQRLALVLSDSDAVAVLTDAVCRGRVTEAGHAVPIVIDIDRERLSIKQRSNRKAHVPLSMDSPAYMIYTSGTTGQPKGVKISHGAIADHCRAVAESYCLSRKDVVLQFAPHSVDTALEQILPTLTFGGRVYLRSREIWSPDEFSILLDSQGLTVIDLPPSYLRELLQAWAAEPSIAPERSPRLVIVGGEALTLDLVQLWRSGVMADARLINAYGPTEATITSTIYELQSEVPTSTVPIGRPLPGTAMYILDIDGNPVPEGVIGELYIAGSRLALGYHDRSKLNAERFVSYPLGPKGSTVRLYRTGDLARFIPGEQGEIAFHGRIDDQLNIRGFRIEPGEVEVVLREFGVKDAAVLSDRNGDVAASLTAYVVPGDAEFGTQELLDYLSTRLPQPFLPSTFVYLKALPLTPAGKLDRDALFNINAYPETNESVPPRNKIEARLLRLWIALLGRNEELEPLGVFDDFFMSGGHSLLTLRLLTEIRREFGCQLTIASLITATNIADQARLLCGQVGERAITQDDSLLVCLRPGENNSPLFLMHPVGGSVTCYLDLARGLTAGRPVYGLQVPVFEGNKPTACTLVSMATNYVAAIRNLKAEGPYHLAGWSLGGVLAFEMARQLRAAGECVGMLGLIESYTPALLRRLDSGYTELPVETDLVREFARDLLNVDKLSLSFNDVLPDTDPVQVLLEIPQVKALFGADSERLKRLYAVFRTNRQALLDYRPKACDVSVTLIRAKSVELDDETLGWSELAREGVTSYTAKGDHYTILHKPGLNACVEILDDALTRTEECWDIEDHVELRRRFGK